MSAIDRRALALVRSAFHNGFSSRVVFALGEPYFHSRGFRRDGPAVELRNAGSILVMRLDEIGDIVLTTPFLRELRRNAPGAWITLVVRPEMRDLVELCPFIDELLTYRWQARRCGRSWRLLWFAARHLWPRRFDVALVPRWDADEHQATLLAYVSGARCRVGYSERATERRRRLNRGFDRLITTVVDDPAPRHEVERGLVMLRRLGVTVQRAELELWTGRDDDRFAARLLASHDVGPDARLVAFGIGAREPRRRWPVDRFVEVGAWLMQDRRTRIVVVGADEDRALGETVRQALGDVVINAAGQTTLRQLGALLKRCSLYVGSDSGPMHIATAFGIPVVEISCHPVTGSAAHPNAPQRFRPWGVRHVVLQPPGPADGCVNGCTSARAHCIFAISVAEARRAIQSLA